MKTGPSFLERLVEPTKIANARPREIERAATKIATAKENTIPTLAKVRSNPDATPKSCPGATFITAALFAGMQPPAPIPFSTAAAVTTARASNHGQGRWLDISRHQQRDNHLDSWDLLGRTSTRVR